MDLKPVTKLQDQQKDNLSLKNTVRSKNYLKVYRTLFETDAWKDNIFKVPLEEAWQSYTHSQNLKTNLAEERNNTKRDAFDSFVSNIQFGMLPPPETLLIVAEAMQAYLHANGDISLDEAFSGESIRKIRLMQ